MIPAWCEAERIAQVVRAAAELADEVIVVDAASPDGTAAAAAAAGAMVVQSPRGRGSQLHAGARAAYGEILLFLHADCSLSPGARDAIHRALSDPTVVGGNFRLRFEPASTAARLYACANDLRRRWLAIYYGDSGVFIRRESYFELGGFRPWPLFEDYEFIRRLERSRRTQYVRDVVIAASARRFATKPLRTLMVWALLQSMYSAGVHPQRLCALYRDVR